MRIEQNLALAYLKKQKGRTITLVTGIALAVMLVVGFNIISESQSKNQLNTIFKLYGHYHAEFNNLNSNVVDKVKKDSNISQVYTSANLGKIVDSKGISIKLNSSSKEFLDKQEYSLKKGHLPQKKGEILLEAKVLEKMGLNENLNQNIYFNIKKEYIDKNGEHQIFTKKEQFKLVGIIDKPSQYYNDWYALRGFTTFDPNSENIIPNNLINYDGLVNLKCGTSQIDDTLNKIIKKYDIGRLDFQANTKLITALSDYSFAQNSKSKEDIKILVIITSIFLIYNLFNISLNEMINQIGMLRTVGASKKDVRKILAFQSLTVMIIGIIIGILGGIGFSYLGMKIFNFTATNIDTSLAKVYISKKSILNGTYIGILAIVLSSIIPIWISGRISPLEALRKADRSNKKQKNGIQYKAIRKLFGLTGAMAYKNIWRNKFRTIISVISISLGGMLFINTIAIDKSNVMENTNLKVSSMQDSDFKLSYGANIDSNIVGYTNDDIKKLSSINGISNIKTKIEINGLLKSDSNTLDNSFKKYNGIDTSKKTVENDIIVKSYDDKQLQKFSEFIEKGSLDSLNQKTENIPNAVVFNYYYDILEDNRLEKVRSDIKLGDILTLKIPVQQGDNIVYKDQQVRVSGLLNQEWTFKGDSSNGRYFEVIVPQNDLANISGKNNFSGVSLSVKEGTGSQVNSDIKNLLKNKPFSVVESKLQYEKEDNSSNIEDVKSKMIIVSLILVIACLNIFCTIRTSLLIRTREFATLRSIGMTVKQIKQMIIKESIFYALLSSIIASILGTHKIYKFMKQVNLEYSEGMGIDNVATFKMPIVEIIQFSSIAIIICLVAVYISKRRIEKLNIIEGLKINE